MKLSDKAIQEFREIFAREFKRELSDQDARQHAEAFMRLILLLLRPMPSTPDHGDDAIVSSSIDEHGQSGTL
jgi:hypothetical protein